MRDSRGKRALYAAGILLVFAALGALSYLLYNSILKESAVVAEDEKEIAVLLRKDQEFADAVRDLAEYEAELAAIRRSFVSEDTFVAYLESIESLARFAGVTFEALSADFEVSEKEPAIFTFTAKGGFGELSGFFALLDRLPQSGLLRTVTLTPDPLTSLVEAKADYLIFNHVK